MEALTSTASAAETRPRVVLLGSPGAGHLVPLALLARRLVEHHGFSATLVTFTDDLAAPRLLRFLPRSLVATASLPAVRADDLPADAYAGTLVRELTSRSLPSLRALLRSIIASSSAVPPLAALVPDFLCSGALPLAAEHGVPGYLFVPTNLALLTLMRRLVDLHHGAGPGEYRILPEPLELPGDVSLRRADLPRSFRDCNDRAYPELVAVARRYHRADGFLVNTFYEVQPATVDEFQLAAERGAFPPVFPVGPLVRSSSDGPSGGGGASMPCCLEWLDRQPPCSVVYVSFGSGGALSVEQTAELAAGLEESGHRFLWVMRMPSLDGRAFHLEDSGDDDDPLAWLPEGFLARTKGRGLAVAAWAPQVGVLSHPATAAFVSHCGWNSTMESVASGVPMIAWPLYAEQRVNAAILEGKDVGVALRARAREDDDGVAVVTRGEVAGAVREIMEGEKGRAVRGRAQDLRRAAARAVSTEGSARRALEEATVKWKAAGGLLGGERNART